MPVCKARLSPHRVTRSLNGIKQKSPTKKSLNSANKYGSYEEKLFTSLSNVRLSLCRFSLNPRLLNIFCKQQDWQPLRGEHIYLTVQGIFNLMTIFHLLRFIYCPIQVVQLFTSETYWLSRRISCDIHQILESNTNSKIVL